MLESKAITQEEAVMRTLLLAGVLAVAGFAIATPISIAPASAQVATAYSAMMSAFLPGAEMRLRAGHVCFGPTDDIREMKEAAI